ncbi:MAG: ATP-binding protein, partial [Magnetococcus sp. WYHC-3]
NPTTLQVIIANHSAEDLGLQEGESAAVSLHADAGSPAVGSALTFFSPACHALENRVPCEAEFPLYRQGERRIYQFHAVPVAGRDGQVTTVILSAIDVTESRRAEERERYASFQSGVAEMSISILHNIGNAIMSIMNRSERIQDNSAELERMAALLGRIRESVRGKLAQGREAGQVLEDLLGVFDEITGNLGELATRGFQDNARRIRLGVEHISEIIKIHQESAQYTLVTSFDLKTLLEDAVLIQSDTLRKYHIEVSIQVQTGMPELRLPRSQMLQLMINLIKNSREAIAEVLREQPGHVGTVVLQAEPVGDGRMQLRVQDNGCGIDPKHLEEIFRFGFSTKERGTGYGLHSAANFVQSLGGSIEASSAGPGQGATFLMLLPMRWERAAESGADAGGDTRTTAVPGAERLGEVS